MKVIKMSMLIVCVFLIIGCNPSIKNIPTINENNSAKQTPENGLTSTLAFTATPAPTPTLIRQSEYGRIVNVIGERLFFNNNANPGVLSITDRDLSNPVSIGEDIPGYKWIESISPDGKWIVFYTNSVQSNEPCDSNNVYISSSDGSVIQHLNGTTCRIENNFNDQPNWDITNTKHILSCMDPEKGTWGVCAIKIEGEKSEWVVINSNTSFGEDVKTSPNQRSALYHEKMNDKNCISIIDYPTLQNKQFYCKDVSSREYIFGELIWLNDNQSFITTYGPYFLRGNTEKGQLLFFSLLLEEPEELFTYVGNATRLALSTNNNNGVQSRKPVTVNQVVLCVKELDATQLSFYLYDLNSRALYKIEDTTVISAALEPNILCGNVSAYWDDSNKIYLLTRLGLYLVDFSNGTINEEPYPFSLFFE